MKNTTWLKWFSGYLTLCVALVAGPVLAADRTWNKSGDTGNTTRNLNDSAHWSGGLPTNGDDAFLIWNRGTGGPNGHQVVTNATTDVFVADSLSITNASTSDKGSITVNVSGQTFLTNGLGALRFAGTTGPSDIRVTFSGNLAAKVISVRGGGGSGFASLTLAGATTAGSLTYDGGSGSNALVISGPLSLSDALIITNLNLSSLGTLSGGATVGRTLIDNASAARFTITNSTLTVTGTVQSVAGGFTLADNATLTVSGTGGLTLSNVAPVVNGTVNILNSTLNGKTVWNNNGTINLQNGYLVGLTLTNLFPRVIAGSGTISNLVFNAGVVAATNGELRLIQPVVGPGVYRALPGGVGGTLTFVNGGSLSALFNTGATVRIQGVLTNTSVFINRGTVTLDGGTYHSSSSFINPSGFLLNGVGTLAASLNNSGIVQVAGGGLTFGGTVQNSGLMGATNGTMRFQSTAVNTGTLALHSSTAIFQQNLTLDSTGVLTADNASTLRIHRDFLNNSTQNTSFDLLHATVIFDGGGPTQTLTVAGLDLGLTFDGFTNNFALGTLQIGDAANATVSLSGPAGRALYVNSLTLQSGSVLRLNGLTIYTATPAVLDGTVVSDGGMILLIPEPSSWTLVGCGLALLFMVTSRRR